MSIQIGDKRGILKNPEDCMTMILFECVDVYETGPQEKDIFAEWEIKKFKGFGEKFQAKFGEGTPPYGQY